MHVSIFNTFTGNLSRYLGRFFFFFGGAYDAWIQWTTPCKIRCSGARILAYFTMDVNGSVYVFLFIVYWLLWVSGSVYFFFFFFFYACESPVVLIVCVLFLNTG
jgi:hypothetical protein